jgi:hypothetical protein
MSIEGEGIMIKRIKETWGARPLKGAFGARSAAPFHVRGRGDWRDRRRSYPLSGDVIWIVGCAGSGKSEVSHAFQKKAADAGMRSITFANHKEFAFRWEHVAHLEFFPDNLVSGHEGRVIASAVRQGATHTFVTVPVLMKTAEAAFARLLVEIEAWIDGWDHEPLVLVIRESDFLVMLRPDLVRPLAEKVARTGGRLLIEAYDYARRISPLVREGDEILLGRSVDTSVLGVSGKLIKDIQSLREGEFFLKRGDVWVPVEPPYVPPESC